MKRVTLQFADDEQAEKFAAMVRMSSAVTIPKYGNRATILQVLIEPELPHASLANRVFEDAANSLQAGHPADQGALLTGILKTLLKVEELLTPQMAYEVVADVDIPGVISRHAAEQALDDFFHPRPKDFQEPE